jgi:hypothetical protein
LATTNAPRDAPVGFQLVGKHLSEDLLPRAGHAFRSIKDWYTSSVVGLILPNRRRSLRRVHSPTLSDNARRPPYATRSVDQGTLAVPSMPQLECSEGVPVMLGRVTSSPEAIAELAGVAADDWERNTHRGDGNQDRPRHLLMQELHKIYREIFDYAPTVSYNPLGGKRRSISAGLAIIWSRAFFRSVSVLLVNAPKGDAGAAALARIAQDVEASVNGGEKPRVNGASSFHLRRVVSRGVAADR